jgi:hypothetical protein
MTQDNYMARNRVHTEVAELLDRAISDEQTMAHSTVKRKIASEVGRAGLEPATNGL